MPEPLLDPILRPATENDSRFVYETKRAAIGQYIESVWGQWNEPFQLNYHRKNFDPSVTRIITVQSYNVPLQPGTPAQTDIGVLTVRDYPEYLMLESIYLLPAYQRQGIGENLIRQLLTQAGTKNRPVRLHVLKINPAVRLYNRLKFRIIAETDNHYIMEWSK